MMGFVVHLTKKSVYSNMEFSIFSLCLVILFYIFCLLKFVS